jgi:hypothetical protein
MFHHRQRENNSSSDCHQVLYVPEIADCIQAEREDNVGESGNHSEDE